MNTEQTNDLHQHDALIKKLRRQRLYFCIITLFLLTSNIVTYLWNSQTKKFMQLTGIKIKSTYNYLTVHITNVFNWIMSQKIDITNVFNNRELAFCMWGIIAIILLLMNHKTRTSIIGVVKALFNKKFVELYFWMLLYTVFIIFMLHRIGFWELYLLKDTIIWFIFTGVISAFRSIEKAKDFDYFKELIKDYVKCFIIFQFIVNFYTFSLVTEFILIPIIFMISGVIATIQIVPTYQTKEYELTKKLFNFINIGIGLLIILNSIFLAVKDIKNLGSINNLKALLLPSIISISFLIFNYFLALLSSYEQIFIRIKFGEKKSKRLIIYIKFKILLLCRINLKKLNKIRSENLIKILNIREKEDVIEFINTYK